MENNKPGYPMLINRDLHVVLGLPFDNVNTDQAASLIEQSVASRRRCFLSTPNLNFVIQAHRDANFYASVVESDLVIADGMPIIWIARLLGIPLPERVAGSSLFQLLREKHRDRPIRVFFFGGQDNVAEMAGAKLQQDSAGMLCCGFLNPGIGTVASMSTEEIIQQINAAQPDFLVVALGAVKGQRWIMHNQARIKAPVISHLGAVINFVAGEVCRAPRRWQRMGGEWLWRISQEHHLARRYLLDGLSFIYLWIAKAIPLAIYQYWLRLQSDIGPSIKVTTGQFENYFEIGLIGSATGANRRLLQDGCQKALDKPCTIIKHVRLNCAELDYIDSGSLGLLLNFKLQLSERGQTLSFFNMSDRIRTLMGLHGVQQFLLASQRR